MAAFPQQALSKGRDFFASARWTLAIRVSRGSKQEGILGVVAQSEKLQRLLTSRQQAPHAQLGQNETNRSLCEINRKKTLRFIELLYTARDGRRDAVRYATGLSHVWFIAHIWADKRRNADIACAKDSALDVVGPRISSANLCIMHKKQKILYSVTVYCAEST